MPEIQPSSIASFSSEDKEYPASNLLKPSGFNKWKCEKPGEKNATVEFQLSQAEQINQIDIGNEGSAFVEVLVRRTGAEKADFNVLLPSSSFMSPMEARSRSGTNRVRIFKADRLARAVMEQKWDRIRVVCSQPFSRTENYGLAFIRFYRVESDAEAEASSPAKKQKTLAGFAIRDEPEDEEKKEVPLSLFSKRKAISEDEDEDSTPGPSSIATQIRSASKVAEKTLAKAREEKETKTRSQPSTASSAPAVRKRSSEEDSEGSGPSAKKSKKKETSSRPEAGPSERRTPVAKKEAEAPAFNVLMRGVVFCMSGYENPLRSQLRDKAQAMGATYHANWGRDSTHLICAFVDTPKYREVCGKGRIVTAKWIEQCHKRRTLLPWRDFRLGRASSPPGSSGEGKKRRQAAQKAAPVRDESSDEEEVLPQKRTRAAPRARHAADAGSEEALGTSDSDSEAELRRRKKERLKRKRKRDAEDDSEEEWRPRKSDPKDMSDSEPDAEIAEDSRSEESSEDNKKTKKMTKKQPAPQKKRFSKNDEDDDDDEEEKLPARKNRAAAADPRASPSRKELKTSPKAKAKVSLLDGSDSDDGGWAPVRRKKGPADNEESRSTRTPSPSKSKNSEEKPSTSKGGDVRAGELPDLFRDTTFFFYGAFADDTARLLRRVVIAYGGSLAQYMSDSVKFVVTASKWDDNFDDALAENSSLLFVRPQWLFECDRRRKFVPYQKFQVVG